MVEISSAHSTSDAQQLLPNQNRCLDRHVGRLTVDGIEVERPVSHSSAVVDLSILHQDEHTVVPRDVS